MQLPFFFEEIVSENKHLILSENSSRHIVQVLRMREGEQLQITNGKGFGATATIVNAHKKNTEVALTDIFKQAKPSNEITIAISLIKNVNRFEWFLEKATEIGVNHIVPLICGRTEKTNFKEERWNQILISAMLQSRQYWCPQLEQPVKFQKFIERPLPGYKFIAYCDEGDKQTLPHPFQQHDRTILIGPEGDFTQSEIEAAKENQFTPVTLGNTRLRTETAAMVTAVLMVQ